MALLITTFQYILSLPFRLHNYSFAFFVGVFGILVWLFLTYLGGTGLSIFVALVLAFFIYWVFEILGKLPFWSPFLNLYSLLETYVMSNGSRIKNIFDERSINRKRIEFPLVYQQKFWGMITFREALFINQYCYDYKKYMKNTTLESIEIEEDLEKRINVIYSIIKENYDIINDVLISKKSSKFAEYLEERKKNNELLKQIKGLSESNIKELIINKLAAYEDTHPDMHEFINTLKRSDLSDRFQYNLNNLYEMIVALDKANMNIASNIKPAITQLMKIQKKHDDDNHQINVRTISKYKTYFDNI